MRIDLQSFIIIDVSNYIGQWSDVVQDFQPMQLQQQQKQQQREQPMPQPGIPVVTLNIVVPMNLHILISEYKYFIVFTLRRVLNKYFINFCYFTDYAQHEGEEGIVAIANPEYDADYDGDDDDALELGEIPLCPGSIPISQVALEHLRAAYKEQEEGDKGRIRRVSSRVSTHKHQ